MECIAVKLYSTCVLYAESTLHLHAHQIPLQTHHLSHATTVRQTVAAWAVGGGGGGWLYVENSNLPPTTSPHNKADNIVIRFSHE